MAGKDFKATEDSRVVVPEADLGKSTKSHHFREKFSERTVSLGIVEQNMMIVAAGMASGKIPHVYMACYIY